jgi:hypothetical protein
VVTLMNVANPVACFFALFVEITAPCAISTLTLVGSACGAYIITAAALSPTPPLVNEQAGAAIVVWKFYFDFCVNSHYSETCEIRAPLG